MKRIGIFVVLIAALGACDSRTEFRVEPTGHKTFGPQRILRAGEVVHLRVSGLKATQRLRFHRCGPRCNSAFSVATWGSEQLPPDGQVLAEVPDDGDYYFWVEDLSQPNDGNALAALGSYRRSEGLVVDYGALKVVVEGVHPNASPEPARER